MSARLYARLHDPVPGAKAYDVYGEADGADGRTALVTNDLGVYGDRAAIREWVASLSGALDALDVEEAQAAEAGGGVDEASALVAALGSDVEVGDEVRAGVAGRSALNGGRS